MGQKSPETAYTLFGREIHEQIEKDITLAHIPRLKEKEYEITHEIDGIPIRAFIDTIDLDTLQFYEYKTGLVKGDGSMRWTQKLVDNHYQLPFYALLLKAKFGRYNPETQLIMLETEWKHNVIQKKQAKIIISEELALTGRTVTFNRTITENDLEEVRKWIVDGANQIITDYDWWQHIDGENNLKG